VSERGEIGEERRGWVVLKVRAGRGAGWCEEDWFTDDGGLEGWWIDRRGG